MWVTKYVEVLPSGDAQGVQAVDGEVGRVSTTKHVKVECATVKQGLPVQEMGERAERHCWGNEVRW